MMRHLPVTTVATLVFAGLASSSCLAQFSQQNRITRYSGNLRTPTSNILSRPTVSPYLALTDLTGSGNIDSSRNYFTQVRPQLDSQASQQRNRQAIINVQNRVASLRSTAARQSFPGVRSTGHPTRFGTYLHYYPGFGR